MAGASVSCRQYPVRASPAESAAHCLPNYGAIAGAVPPAMRQAGNVARRLCDTKSRRATHPRPAVRSVSTNRWTGFPIGGISVRRVAKSSMSEAKQTRRTLDVRQRYRGKRRRWQIRPIQRQAGGGAAIARCGKGSGTKGAQYLQTVDELEKAAITNSNRFTTRYAMYHCR